MIVVQLVFILRIRGNERHSFRHDICRRLPVEENYHGVVQPQPLRFIAAPPPSRCSFLSLAPRHHHRCSPAKNGCQNERLYRVDAGNGARLSALLVYSTLINLRSERNRAASGRERQNTMKQTIDGCKTLDQVLVSW